MKSLKIGGLAALAGTSAPTIRYYEQVGLLRRPDRHDSGHRIYTEHDVEKLTFIRRCRDFDFSIEQVKSLVQVMESPACSCMDARDVAASHLEAVQERLEELIGLEQSLAKFVESCDTSCAGGPGPECVIIGELGKPAEL